MTQNEREFLASFTMTVSHIIILAGLILGIVSIFYLMGDSASEATGMRIAAMSVAVFCFGWLGGKLVGPYCPRHLEGEGNEKP